MTPPPAPEPAGDRAAAADRAPEGVAAPAQGTAPAPGARDPAAMAPEIGGRAGLEPTRYGDWEVDGRCVDF